jgi:uncharacterized membrane protein YbhN (UPF0104 family)
MPGRGALFRWLRVAFGLALLGLLIARVDPSEYRGFLERGDPRQLALGLGLLLLAFPVLQALRLHPLVARYTGSLRTTFAVFMVGAFFNTMLPSNVGGDAVRLLYLRRMRADNWGGPFAMLMLHRASGMGVLLVAAVVHGIVEHQRLSRVLSGVELSLSGPSLWALALVGLAACAALGRWLARSGHPLARRLRTFLADCWRATSEVGLASTLLLLVLTACFHLVRMLAFVVLVRYTGQSIGFWDLLPVLTATALAGVVPLTVGGLGLMEGAISVTLALFGVGEAAAVATALANRAVLLVSAAIGGVVYVLAGPRTHAPEASAKDARLPSAAPRNGGSP